MPGSVKRSSRKDDDSSSDSDCGVPDDGGFDDSRDYEGNAPAGGSAEALPAGDKRAADPKKDRTARANKGASAPPRAPQQEGSKGGAGAQPGNRGKAVAAVRQSSNGPARQGGLACTMTPEPESFSAFLSEDAGSRAVPPGRGGEHTRSTENSSRESGRESGGRDASGSGGKRATSRPRSGSRPQSSGSSTKDREKDKDKDKSTGTPTSKKVDPLAGSLNPLGSTGPRIRFGGRA